jgi:hypothetical protein
MATVDPIHRNGGATIISPAAGSAGKEGDFGTEIQSRDPKTGSIQKYIELGEEFCKRVGFYCALNEDPRAELRRAQADLAQLIRSEIEALTDECDNDIQRIVSRRREAIEKGEEIKQLFGTYTAELPLLEDEVASLRASLDELHKQVDQALVSIGSKKENLIQDRQQAVLEELNRLNEELETVLNKRMSINEGVFDKDKEVLEKKKAFLVEIFGRYQEEHGKVLEKLKVFGLLGNDHINSTFLLNAGLVAVAGAGAFFAFFAEKNAFASGGVIGFVIKALLTFTTGFIGASDTPVTRLANAGLLLGMFLSLLALVFAVSWLCQWAYRKAAGEPNDNQAKAPRITVGKAGTDDDDLYALEISLGIDDPSFMASLADRTLLGFWLKLIPALLVFGIGFLLVSLGTKVDDFKDLDASIAGYGIGVMAALASAGVFYIYLIMVLERRVSGGTAATLEAGRGPSWLRLNIELFLVVLSFLVSLLVILIFFPQPFRDVARIQSWASLMLFVVTCLFAAFSLGFGTRFQGLETARKSLEARCDFIQTRIIRISRPLQTYLTKTENQAFNAHFIKIRNEIMSLMLWRTRVTAEAVTKPLVEKPDPVRASLSRALLWVKEILSRKNRPPAVSEAVGARPSLQEDGVAMSREMALCFPKLEAELGSLQDTAKTVAGRISFVDGEISNRKERKGEFYEEKLQQLGRQERRVRRCDKAITNRQAKLHRAVRGRKYTGTFLEQKITEGYALGEWFTEHGTGVPTIPTIFPIPRLR